MATLQQAAVVVNVASFGPTNSTAISLGGAVSVGDLIIVAYSTNNINRTISSITDAGSTTFAALRAMDTSGAGRCQIWWGIATSTSAGSTIVITLSGAHSDGTRVCVASFSGCAADQSGATSNGENEAGVGPFSSGTVTPPNATGVLFAVRHSSSGTYTPDADFTDIPSGASNFGFGYRLDSGDAQSYDYTADASETTATQINAFAGSGGPVEATISNTSPQAVALTVNGRAATINSFSAVSIRDVLINEAGSPVANRTGMHLLVWYAGAPTGAPDLSYSALTTDANGTASWSLAPGGLAFNQHIFYVATDGGASLSQYTCARMVPTYS